MKGEDFVGALPEDLRWSEDGKSILFSWNPDGDTLRSTYRVNPVSKRISKLSFIELANLPSISGVYSKDFSRKVYEKNGDLFLLDISNQQKHQLFNTVQNESNPQFSGDEKLVIYQQGNDLFARRFSDGAIEQLTNFLPGQKKIKPKLNDMKQWLEDDQLAYFDILKEQKGKSDSRKYRDEEIKPDRPLKIHIGKKQITEIKISPDMNFVVYMLMKAATPSGTIVPDFVTQSGYTKNLNARPKVGSQLHSYETWIYNRKADSAYQIKTEDIPGIYDKPIYRKEYEKSDSVWMEVYNEPRDVIALLPMFSENGKAVFVVRSQDNKDRWIMLLNLEDGTSKLLDRQRDEAWVGGPGISSWNFSSGTIGWLNDNEIWFHSEETGYSHLYTINVNSGKKKALTSGEFEILDAKLSKDKKTFFITSNMASPHEHHFYHLPAKGGKMKQITSVKGGHQVTISPDEKTLAIRFSASNKPWEIYSMPNEPGAEMTQLTNSLKNDFQNYSWRQPEIVRFKAEDGAMVPARLYEPDDSKKTGAAIIFVHGAGYLQNVHEWWSNYYREYMFHNLLADHATPFWISITGPALATVATGELASIAGWEAKTSTIRSMVPNTW